MLPFLRLTGEEEFIARTAGLSSIIVFSTMIPLLLLIIVVSYRYIKRKNLEIEQKEKEIHFTAMEEQRNKIYQKLYEEHHRKEIEIAELFDEKDAKHNDSQSQPNQIQSKVIDGVAQFDHGDSTDDEFFEMPLPPLPQTPPRTGKLSIIDNESVVPVTGVHETPKIDNISSKFKFPPSPTGKPPSPPVKIKSPASPVLPPIPPRPSSISPPPSPKIEQTDQQDSVQPVIIDITPKSLLLQSDF